MRQCGDCQTCCRILPTKEINKPALTKCPHQQHHKGCKIYATRPISCRLWSCVWLMEDDNGHLRRPDHCHYVVDPMPDFAIARVPGQPDRELALVQVWVDPKYPDAHEDPGLREYLNERGTEGFAAIIRYGSDEGFTLFPPSMSEDKQWHDMRGASSIASREHTPRDILDKMEQMGYGFAIKE